MPKLRIWQGHNHVTEEIIQTLDLHTLFNNLVYRCTLSKDDVISDWTFSSFTIDPATYCNGAWSR